MPIFFYLIHGKLKTKHTIVLRYGGTDLRAVGLLHRYMLIDQDYLKPKDRIPIIKIRSTVSYINYAKKNLCIKFGNIFKCLRKQIMPLHLSL